MTPSRRLPAVSRAALAGLAYGADRRAGGLGDLALGAIGIAGDLEVDDRGGAQLGAVGGADRLAAGLLDGLLHRALAAADEAVVEALLLDPVGRRGGAEALGPAARHLAACAGELHDCAAVGALVLVAVLILCFSVRRLSMGAGAIGWPRPMVLRSVFSAGRLGLGPGARCGRATSVGYATSRSFCASASVCSFFSDWFSICRIRSRVTLNVRPTSSSVRGCSPPSP